MTVLRRGRNWFATMIAAVVMSPLLSSAIVDDALSFAYEAAEPFIEKLGYFIRQDSWKGKVNLKKAQAVKHHLTKGNAYWFFLGTDQENSRMAMRVYDKKGKAHEVETKRGKHWIAVKVVPPKTGTYVIAFRVVPPKGVSKASWAMVYGYK